MSRLFYKIDMVWRLTPQYVDTIDGRVDSQVLAAQGDWDQLVLYGIYEERIMPGDAPLGYGDPVVEVDGSRTYAARYPVGTEEERIAAHRKQLEQQIEVHRTAADQMKIDLNRDPGLTVLMDEANASAEQKLIELDGAVDLDAFDPAFDPREIGAVATARSLVVQETALSSDPGLTQAEKDDLSASAAAHQAVVDAGDDTAAVPPVPFSVRRLVGTAGEDYGVLIARRTFSGGWWWLTFELQTERELDVSEYWIALYLEDGTYLVTPQLTQVLEGVYEADTAAVNRPETDTGTAYSFTLCRGHITEEQFARVVLNAGVESQRYRVRWGGNVESGGPGGTEWVDTGATVASQAGQLYQISDEAVVAALTPGQQIKFTETGAETTFTGVWPGGTDYVEIDPFVQAAVGDALWSFE